jgi:hypothetical protein
MSAGHGLKVGDLYVAFSATTSEFNKGMLDVIKGAERATKQIAKLAHEAENLTRPFAIAAAGAVAAAATTNRQMQQQVSRSKDLFLTLASDIGKGFAPALSQANEALAKAVAFFQDLSPETKQQISDWAMMALKFTIAAVAVAKITDGLHAVVEAAKAAGEAIKAAFSFQMFIPALAAVVGLLGAIGAIKNALPKSDSKATKAAAPGYFNNPLVDSIREHEKKRREENPTLGEMLSDKLKAMFFTPSAGASNLGVLGESVKTGAETVFGPLAEAIKPLFDALQKLGETFNKADPKKAKIASKLDDPLNSILDPDHPRAKLSPFKPLPHGRLATFDPVPIVTEGERFARSVHDALRSAGERISTALLDGSGAFGSLIKSAMQGFAEGGPIGALIAGATDLLMQSRQFADVVSMLGTVVQSVANAVGALLAPLEPLIGAISIVIDAIASALTPVFQLLGAIVEPLIPPLVIVGEILQALAPVISIVSKAMLLITAPLQLLGGPVMRGLFEVLKFVGQALLGIVGAIAPFWNGVVGFVADLLRGLASIPLLSFLNDWADGLDSMKIDVAGIDDAYKQLTATTWESAKATANETAERIKGSRAMQDVTEALTNVPEGYKVALTRFRATDPVGAALPTYSAPLSSSGSAPTGTNATTIVNNFYGITDTTEMVAQIDKVQRLAEARRTGRPMGGPRYSFGA